VAIITFYVAFFFWMGTLATEYVLGLWSALPIPNGNNLYPEQSITLTDRTGEELYRIIQNEDRVSLQKSDIPLAVQHAFIAAEDERFYSRKCIDPEAIARAAVANIREYKSQGGSTITQQLVRSIFLVPEKKIERKIQEILLACRLEQQMRKEDILALYVNRVPFGGNLYGIEQAAQAYFGISAKDLSIAQAAVLAGLPQRPTYYAPFGPHMRTSIPPEIHDLIRRGILRASAMPPENIDLGLLDLYIRTPSGVATIPGRAHHVLNNMQRLGFITNDEFFEAEQEMRVLSFRPAKRMLARAPHFVLWTKETVGELIASQQEWEQWPQAGLRVKTTLDPQLQAAAEEAVKEVFPAIREKQHGRNVALLAADRRTGKILAYVGNADYNDDAAQGKIDMVQAPRQPGSTFKPIVYAAAFEKGYTPDSFIYDTPMHIGADTPKNYEGGFWGRLTIRRALAGSRNIPAIRAFYLAGGEETVLAFANEVGVHFPTTFRSKQNGQFSYGWPLAIGSAEVPLLEMVQAYSTLANRGVYRPLTGIESIHDWLGNTFYDAANRPVQQVMDAQIADDIVSILEDEKARPQGYWRNQLSFPQMTVGVKTGTSNVCLKRGKSGKCTSFGVNNTWAMGFTENLVFGVWVGNADNSLMTADADGLTTAVPIWKNFLYRARDVKLGAGPRPAPSPTALLTDELRS